MLSETSSVWDCEIVFWVLIFLLPAAAGSDSGAPRGPGLFNLIMGLPAADKQKRFIREEVWRSGDKAAGSCSRRPTPRHCRASIQRLTWESSEEASAAALCKHTERKEKEKHKLEGKDPEYDFTHREFDSEPDWGNNSRQDSNASTGTDHVHCWDVFPVCCSCQ